MLLLKQYKAILKAYMVSTPEGFNDNSPMSPDQSVTIKKSIGNKITLNIFWSSGYQQKTAVCRFGAAKSKQKFIRTGSMLWYSIPQSQGH